MNSEMMIFKLRAAASEWPTKHLTSRDLRAIADQLEYLEIKINRMTGNMHMKD